MLDIQLIEGESPSEHAFLYPAYYTRKGEKKSEQISHHNPVIRPSSISNVSIQNPNRWGITVRRGVVVWVL